MAYMVSCFTALFLMLLFYYGCNFIPYMTARCPVLLTVRFLSACNNTVWTAGAAAGPGDIIKGILLLRKVLPQVCPQCLSPSVACFFCPTQDLTD